MPAAEISFWRRCCMFVSDKLQFVDCLGEGPAIRGGDKLKLVGHYDSPPARSWKSSMLGNSVRSFKPNWIRNSFDVPYIIGRPTVSFLPLATIRRLSSKVLIADGDCTPRISRISGTVTGCL